MRQNSPTQIRTAVEGPRSPRDWPLHYGTSRRIVNGGCTYACRNLAGIRRSHPAVRTENSTPLDFGPQFSPRCTIGDETCDRCILFAAMVEDETPRVGFRTPLAPSHLTLVVDEPHSLSLAFTVRILRYLAVFHPVAVRAEYHALFHLLTETILAMTVRNHLSDGPCLGRRVDVVTVQTSRVRLSTLRTPTRSFLFVDPRPESRTP